MRNEETEKKRKTIKTKTNKQTIYSRNKKTVKEDERMDNTEEEG